MAGDGDVQLLGHFLSPFALRARMALVVKGVRHEYLEQDLRAKGELLLRSNPVHKKVPVLIHAGKPVCESLAIVQYVDEVWSSDGQPAILPADPYHRAVARFWAAFIDDKLFPACQGVMMATTEEETAAKVGETLPLIGHMEDAFAACSNGKPFFGGDSIGYLDLALGCNLFLLRKLSTMAGQAPLLAAWAARFLESAVAKEVAPDAEVALQYTKAHFAELAAQKK